MVPFEQGHERTREGLEAIIEGFQGGLAADGIAQQDNDKINDVILPEPPPCKAHALSKRRKHAKASERMGHEGHFTEP